MKKIIIEILLLYLCISSKIILQSNLQQKISSSDSQQSVVQNTYPYNVKISQAPEAIWIWSKEWNAATCLNPITIKQDFMVEYDSPITVYATADNAFTIQIDGKEILNGNNWQNLYSKEFSSKCGEIHTFKITAHNYGACSPSNPAGLIYALIQNPSSNKCSVQKPNTNQKIILQSNLQQKISSSDSQQSVVQNTYPYNVKISQAPEAIWIWSKEWNAATCLNPITIKQDFMVEYDSPITVYATADNAFTIQIDGKEILNGNNWQNLYSKEFSSKCGEIHTFKITAHNYGACSPSNPAGLIYALIQNPSSNKCSVQKPNTNQKIILQSNLQQKISSSDSQQSVVQNTYPYNVKISQAPEAIWIWSKEWNAATCLNPITIKQDFMVEYDSPITVYATADNAFTIQIDGKEILNGNNWQNLYSKEFSSKCGEIHTFKITAHNYGACSPSNPAGLIYALIQNPSSNKCIGESYHFLTIQQQNSDQVNLSHPSI